MQKTTIKFENTKMVAKINSKGLQDFKIYGTKKDIEKMFNLLLKK